MTRYPSHGVALVGLLLVLGAGSARGADTWSKPFKGVRYLKRVTSNPARRIHVLEINLCAAGVRARATAEGQRGRTVSSFGALVNAQAAINGDFFSFATHMPSGLAVAGGKTWHADSKSAGFVAFGAGKANIDLPSHVASPVPSWITHAVGGHPLVLQGGKAVNNGTSLCTARHPRTAAGLTAARDKLFLAVVDGRTSASVGMTCAELGKLMAGLGAAIALNLDGGGSSTMWIKGKGVVNSPSDGSQRVVGNHLAIVAAGSGASPHCKPPAPGPPPGADASVAQADGGVAGDDGGATGELGDQGSGGPADAGVAGSDDDATAGYDDPTDGESMPASAQTSGCAVAERASDPACRVPWLLALLLPALRRRARKPRKPGRP